MKLIELIEARNALPLDARDASAKTKYKIAKFLMATKPDFDYYSSEYTNIVTAAAKLDEAGQMIIDAKGGLAIDPAKAPDYLKKTKELQEVEVTTETPKFTNEELEEMHLSVGDTLKLFPFIEEET